MPFCHLRLPSRRGCATRAPPCRRCSSSTRCSTRSSAACCALHPEATVAGSRRLPRFSRHSLLLLAALGALAACGAFVEDAGSSWAALYLRGEVGAGAATAGLAFVALQVAMAVGRLTGDRVVDRFGQRRIALAGGAGIALGMGVALATPSLGATLAGFAMAGLGVATLIPAVMHTADEFPGLPHGVCLTVVSWLLRVGFLISPSVVGIVADATSLRVALLGVVLAGLGVLVFGRVLI
jgi:MFS family permease